MIIPERDMMIHLKPWVFCGFTAPAVMVPFIPVLCVVSGVRGLPEPGLLPEGCPPLDQKIRTMMGRRGPAAELALGGWLSPGFVEIRAFFVR